MTRMGMVKIELEYAVDLDDKDMVKAGIEAIYEDVMNAVKYDELENYIIVESNSNLDPELIPEFLLKDEEV